MDHWRSALADLRGGESKYKALVQVITQDIERGVLKDGARLPAQRDVSKALGISIQTVTNAYKDLERHSTIRCEVGRGSFVSRRTTEQVATYMLDHDEQSLVDFSIARIVHTPAHDQAWQKTCADLSREGNQPWMRECRPIAGFEHHRAAGVQWLEMLGVNTSTDRLLITNGAAHGIFLALAAVVSPGDVVLSDSLTDHGVIGAAQMLGFNLKGLDIDEYGIQPDHFEDLCANERITALACTPNLNNPTVSLMPDSRRRAIAKIAERYGVYVIEDDVYGPLLAKRLATISSYLPDLSFYCTSFTKSVLTGLRIGYLSVPSRMALRVDSLLRVTTWMATPLLAEVATRWVSDGTAVRLIDVQRECLSRRHAVVKKNLSSHIIGQHPNALSVWLSLPEHWKLDSLVRELRNRHIAVTLPDPFMVHGTSRPDAFRLCVGADVGEKQIKTAMETMAFVFDQYPKFDDFT